MNRPECLCKNHSLAALKTPHRSPMCKSPHLTAQWLPWTKRSAILNAGKAPLPSGDIQIAAPHVYTCSEHTCVYAGSRQDIIWVSNGSLELAVIYCILTYYIKNLDYPYAFAPFLALMQKFVLPSKVVPRGLINNRLKCFFALLKKKNVI
ncbi:uncharacterized protein [Dermacentor albipictus]|uniref:uncharacterized protein n=1 Tax=Dermacentor albipictus TaxID=60249 RepID=UPI0031FC0EF2